MHLRLHLTLATLGLFALGGCRCSPGVVAAAPARLSLTPARLVLGSVYVGQQAVGAVSAVNEGSVAAEVDVSVATPFTVDTSQLRLAGGSSVDLVVTFTPLQPGPASGVLYVGTLEVPVEALGLEVPACFNTSVCAEAHFDFARAQCVQQAKDDGVLCETSCVTGACSAGTCLGKLKGCDDADACTVDACSESAGCSHLPLNCPAPTSPCQVARCDSATGCGTEPALDGTLCGPDLCTATQVDVCIAGACVTRVRPDTGRCANRWVPTSIAARNGHAMVWDAARHRIVLFGGNGYLSDTWEWDGTTWLERTPARLPLGRSNHAMAWDAARQRVVLFGGYSRDSRTLLSDTWEWDGTTWLERTPRTSPSMRSDHLMAWDAVRQRVVLVGGFGGGLNGGLGALSDVWEWDGRTWTERKPVTSPPPRRSPGMAWDAARQRLVLFGGRRDLDGIDLADTWEWDGATWLQRSPSTSPSPRISHGMAFDALRQRVVLFGGGGANASGWTGLSDTWEWDGSNWTQLRPTTSPPARFGASMAWDTVRQRLVLFGGWGAPPDRSLADTWEWDGATWAQRTPTRSPPGHSSQAMASDPVHRRVVLFGGLPGSNPGPGTWEWDGSTWAQATPIMSPPARRSHAMAWDAARQRILLFGGMHEVGNHSTSLADTWEWDGATWAQHTPTTSPSGRSGHSMAWDAARQRAVLFGGLDDSNFGGNPLAETWEWDGATWAQRTPTNSPSARRSPGMAWEASRQRVVLFGGHDGSSPLADTWEWDGSNWAQRTPAVSPPRRYGHAMAWDEARQRVLLFGGNGGSITRSDTWEWDGSNWAQRTPVASPAGGFGVLMAWDAQRQRFVVFDEGTLWVLLP
jgi:hypothetical protein